MTVTPAHILAKVVYAALGFVYWFLIPVLCAMTRKQRSMCVSFRLDRFCSPTNILGAIRIPPLFWDIPTDAEYAMEIIAKRVANGQSVVSDKKQIRNITEAYGARSKRDLLLKNRSRVSLNSAVSPSSPVASPEGDIPHHILTPDSLAEPAVYTKGLEGVSTARHRGGSTSSPPAMTPPEVSIPSRFTIEVLSPNMLLCLIVIGL